MELGSTPGTVLGLEPLGAVLCELRTCGESNRVCGAPLAVLVGLCALLLHLILLVMVDDRCEDHDARESKEHRDEYVIPGEGECTDESDHMVRMRVGLRVRVRMSVGREWGLRVTVSSHDAHKANIVVRHNANVTRLRNL